MSANWTVTETNGSVGILTLNRGTTNPLNLEFVQQLSAALAAIRNDGEIRSLVITSANDKFFSIGFDLPTLLELDETDFRAFYTAYGQLALDLYSTPKPTLAALTGHAIAGGCILSLCCDYRTIAVGRTLIGLNEIKLGLPIPFVADQILRDLLGSRLARDVMEIGDFYPPEDAERIGIIDRVLPPDQIRKSSVGMAEAMGANPLEAYRLIKANRTRPVVEAIEARMHLEEQALLECWYSDAAQALLREAAEKF